MTACAMWRRGQSITHYVITAAAVVAVVLGMSRLAQRNIQGVLKMAADDLSPVRAKGGSDPDGIEAQLEGMRYEIGQRPDGQVAPGFVMDRQMAVQTESGARTNLRETTGGRFEYNVFEDTTRTVGAVPGQSGLSFSTSVVVSEEK